MDNMQIVRGGMEKPFAKGTRVSCLVWLLNKDGSDGKSWQWRDVLWSYHSKFAFARSESFEDVWKGKLENGDVTHAKIPGVKAFTYFDARAAVKAEKKLSVKDNGAIDWPRLRNGEINQEYRAAVVKKYSKVYKFERPMTVLAYKTFGADRDSLLTIITRAPSKAEAKLGIDRMPVTEEPKKVAVKWDKTGKMSVRKLGREIPVDTGDDDDDDEPVVRTHKAKSAKRIVRRSL